MSSKTAKKTVYAVQTFTRAKGGGFTIDNPMPAQSAEQARRLAQRKLSPAVIGSLAFSRTGDPDAGEYGEPVILAQFGQVPIDLSELHG